MIKMYTSSISTQSHKFDVNLKYNPPRVRGFERIFKKSNLKKNMCSINVLTSMNPNLILIR